MLIDAELANDFKRVEVNEIIKLIDYFVVNSDFFKDTPPELLTELKEKARRLLRVIK